MAISSSSLKIAHSSGAILVVKRRAFFEGQIVGGEMRRLKFQRRVKIGFQFCKSLARDWRRSNRS